MNRNFCFLTELVLACRCLCVSPAVLLVLANSHTFAVPIIDNFELDTSGNYQGTDWFGTGGSFLVAGGKLRVTIGEANTYMVLLNTGSHFLEVNERFSVEVPGGINTAGPGVNLFSTAMPSNADAGFRFRRQNGSLVLSRFGGGPAFQSSLVDPFPLQPLTLVASRISETKFQFGYMMDGSSDYLTVENTAINGTTQLHVGVEAFRNISQVFEFDNLRITSIPEPCSIILVALATLLFAGRLSRF